MDNAVRRYLRDGSGILPGTTPPAEVLTLMDFVLLYIDPGSGSLIIQAVIAGLVAIPFFFRAQVAKGVRAVKRIAGREPEESRADQGARHG